MNTCHCPVNLLLPGLRLLRHLPRPPLMPDHTDTNMLMRLLHVLLIQYIAHLVLVATLLCALICPCMRPTELRTCGNHVSVTVSKHATITTLCTGMHVAICGHTWACYLKSTEIHACKTYMRRHFPQELSSSSWWPHCGFADL